MRDPRVFTLALLSAAVVLFFFSLTLLPIVQDYCQNRHVAVVLAIVQSTLVIGRVSHSAEERALAVATVVFAVLGIFFNFALIRMAVGRCG